MQNGAKNVVAYSLLSRNEQTRPTNEYPDRGIRRQAERDRQWQFGIKSKNPAGIMVSSQL
jgi:hypothetical protein